MGLYGILKYTFWGLSHVQADGLSLRAGARDVHGITWSVEIRSLVSLARASTRAKLGDPHTSLHDKNCHVSTQGAHGCIPGSSSYAMPRKITRAIENAINKATARNLLNTVDTIHDFLQCSPRVIDMSWGSRRLLSPGTRNCNGMRCARTRICDARYGPKQSKARGCTMPLVRCGSAPTCQAGRPDGERNRCCIRCRPRTRTD